MNPTHTYTYTITLSANPCNSAGGTSTKQIAWTSTRASAFDLAAAVWFTHREALIVMKEGDHVLYDGVSNYSAWELMTAYLMA